MRNELLFLTMVSAALLSGCEGNSGGTDSGAGSSATPADASNAQIAIIAQDNSVINADIEEVDIITVDASDESTVNIDTTTPQQVFSGIETTEIQPQSIEAASACDDPSLSTSTAEACRESESGN